ncbi:MAG: hypothetical protein RQ824_12295 [bacterium]|nr:hypothetical protein [bacterium]
MSHYKKRKDKYAAYFATVALLFFFTACASRPVIERRPLSEKELNVKEVGAEQKVTLSLKESCKPVGKIKTFRDSYDIAIATVASGGNVAQVINGMKKVSGVHMVNPNAGIWSYDVRFWKCP